MSERKITFEPRAEAALKALECRIEQLETTLLFIANIARQASNGFDKPYSTLAEIGRTARETVGKNPAR